MATLVLSGIGTLVGGPIGQAIGALVGSQVDRAIFGGGGSREGARLKELAITTSSYGQALPRQFGRMRVGGTVIWATDIRESSTTEGGKGQPSTTTYSYSASFAVALSSTPLSRIGRIWADGNLLRGAGEDLKVEGNMRAYLGSGDDGIDPLIAADQGAKAPAFRDCAYAVFEDLALADFGNRIPALTFEIFALDDRSVSLEQIMPDAVRLAQPTKVSHARGFADDGGAVVRSLSAINEVLPLSCVTTLDGVKITAVDQEFETIHLLPEQLQAPDDGEKARHNQRAAGVTAVPLALRYYDEERDYQPGVQRAVGVRPNGLEAMVDLPATMNASGARQLISENAQRARWRRERVTWLIGELDHQITPGTIVSLPGSPGAWRVVGWEWFDRGIELELERLPPQAELAAASDPGNLIEPIDLPISATLLDFFEIPSDGSTSPDTPIHVAAVSAETSVWRGAALFAQQGTSLTSIGSASATRAVTGRLVDPIEPSYGLLFEPNSSLLIELDGDDLAFEPTDLSGLALGANRLLVGAEVLQFADAALIDGRTWRLTGLLRGRAGTEDHASLGHASSTRAAFLDSRLTILDQSNAAIQTASTIAAAGRADSEPAYSSLRNAGLSRRPPCPIHARAETLPTADMTFRWTRRARGGWIWKDGVEAPLVEESELYHVGYGDTLLPFTTWSAPVPEITFSQAERDALVAGFGPGALWVRQIGTHGVSAPLLLANFV